MEVFLYIIFLYIAFQIFVLCVQMITNLIGYLLDMLCGLAIDILIACWKKFWPMLKLLGETLSAFYTWAANKIWATVVFSYFLMVESICGDTSPPNDSDQETETETEDNFFAQEANNNVYAEALALLGLQSGCTQKMLNAAFKKAMATAHPDKGGTHEMALAVNAARTIIKTHNGWR